MIPLSDSQHLTVNNISGGTTLPCTPLCKERTIPQQQSHQRGSQQHLHRERGLRQSTQLNRRLQQLRQHRASTTHGETRADRVQADCRVSLQDEQSVEPSGGAV